MRCGAALSALALATAPVAVLAPRAASATSVRGPAPTGTVAVVGDGAPAAVVPAHGDVVPRPSFLARGASAETVARTFLDGVGRPFGVDGSAGDVALESVSAVGGGDRTVRFQQVVGGLPVYAGELVVQLDAAGDLRSVTGETTGATTAAAASVGTVRARSAARSWVRRHAAGAGSVLSASAPVELVYDPALVGAPGTRVRTVWQVLVSGAPGGPSFEVLVDAVTGAVVQAVDRTERLARSLCDDDNRTDTNVADGSWCAPTNVTDEYLTSVDGSHPQALKLYDELGDVSDFYGQVLGVNLTSRIGLDLTSVMPARSAPVLTATVRYCEARSTCPYPNAFWQSADSRFRPGGGRVYLGGQVFLGDGFGAPDVVAHELTHGVTDAVAGLKNLNESGAINESMSDVFGELSQLYDPATRSFDDSRDRYWLIGEGIRGPTVQGPLRNMHNPTSTTLRGGDPQPDRMTSPLWSRGRADDGGVHRDSGVGNKTAYLIARGGTFHRHHVRGIGDRSTARLYWRVEQLLTPGADYRDLAADLSIACRALYGSSSSACGSVRAATAATQIAASTVSVGLSRAVVRRGGTVSLSGTLRSVRGSALYVGRWQGVVLTLSKRAPGSHRWTTVSRRRVGTSGRTSWHVHPRGTTQYRVRYGGSRRLGLLASSHRRTVHVLRA